MNEEPQPPHSKEELAGMILDLFHRSIVHYGLWFSEVRHQMGPDIAHKTIAKVSKSVIDIQLNRYAKVLGFEMKDGIPAPLLDLPEEKLLCLRQSVASNWIVFDGVWFQGIEFAHGMNDAKRCNDSCWAQFAPFEAAMIKDKLGLGENPGLEGLKKALNYRLSSFVNEQSIEDVDAGTIIFRVHKCRVQDARTRKGLPNYSCKTAGLVEYPFFAREIDSRIRTCCDCCPPDPRPKDWWCAWKFTLEE